MWIHLRKVREGDLVWIHLSKERFQNIRFVKLQPRADEPFKIIQKINVKKTNVKTNKLAYERAKLIKKIHKQVRDKILKQTKKYKKLEDKN